MLSYRCLVRLLMSYTSKSETSLDHDLSKVPWRISILKGGWSERIWHRNVGLMSSDGGQKIELFAHYADNKINIYTDLSSFVLHKRLVFLLHTNFVFNLLSDINSVLQPRKMLQHSITDMELPPTTFDSVYISYVSHIYF